MRVARLGLLAGALFAVGACASTSSGDGVQRGDRNNITAEELSSTTVTNLYDFISRARPMWLRVRGPTSLGGAGGIAVYLDDAMFGLVDELRSLQPANVDRIRYLDASAAQQRFGSDHQYGAILVYTRR